MCDLDQRFSSAGGEGVRLQRRVEGRHRGRRDCRHRRPLACVGSGAIGLGSVLGLLHFSTRWHHLYEYYKVHNTTYSIHMKLRPQKAGPPSFVLFAPVTNPGG